LHATTEVPVHRRRLARFHVIAILGLAIAIAGTSGTVVAADRGEQSPSKTGKERLTHKSSDEQRMDDCKVPQSRRTRVRPTDCPQS